MKKVQLPSYIAIQKFFKGDRKDLSPAKIHGLFSGILSAAQTEPTDWRALLAACGIILSESIFDNLFSVTECFLKEGQEEFPLLLPGIKKSLAERAEALTLWCQGFISGFRLILPDENQLFLKGDAKEAMHDLLEIAKMNYEQVVSSDEDEIAYKELINYVSVAVMVLYKREILPVRLAPQVLPSINGVI